MVCNGRIYLKRMTKNGWRLGYCPCCTNESVTRPSKERIGARSCFIVLNMSKEDQDKRVRGRHGDNEDASGVNDYLTELHKAYEPATEDESNALNIQVTPEMTPDDVIAKILDYLKK